MLLLQLSEGYWHSYASKYYLRGKRKGGPLNEQKGKKS